MQIPTSYAAKPIIAIAVSIGTGIFHKIRRMLRRQLFREAALVATAQYVGMGLHLLQTAAAARLLGPTAYGSAVLVMAYPSLLRSFIEFKSNEVTTRYIANFRATGRQEELRSICKLGYLIDFLGAFGAFVVIGATFGWIARHILDMPEMTWVGIAYGATFPILALKKTSSAVLVSWRRFGQLAGCQILSEGLTVIIVLVLLSARLGGPGLILGMGVGHVISGLMTLAAASHVLHCDGLGRWWRTPLRAVAPLRKELTTFFGWNYLMMTLNGVMTQVPLMLLGRMRGPEEAGFYRLAMSLMTVSSYLEGSLVRVTYPVLSARWGTGGQQDLGQTLQRWTLRGGLPACALLLLTIPLLSFVVPMVFGPAYIPMIWGAQVLMLAAAVSAVFFWLRSCYYATGRIGIWAKAYSAYTALIIGFGWLCIQEWGFAGLAALIAFGTITFTVMMVVVHMTSWERLK